MRVASAGRGEMHARALRPAARALHAAQAGRGAAIAGRSRAVRARALRREGMHRYHLTRNRDKD